MLMHALALTQPDLLTSDQVSVRQSAAHCIWTLPKFQLSTRAIARILQLFIRADSDRLLATVPALTTGIIGNVPSMGTESLDFK